MRWFRTALPATAFFVLLFSAAGVGYWFGTQRAGAGASKSTSVYTCSMHPQVRQARLGSTSRGGCLPSLGRPKVRVRLVAQRFDSETTSDRDAGGTACCRSGGSSEPL